MKFNYTYLGHGWGEGTFEANGKKIEFKDSYITSFLADLAELLITINLLSEHDSGVPDNDYLYWTEEGIDYKMVIKRLYNGKIFVECGRWERGSDPSHFIKEISKDEKEYYQEKGAEYVPYMEWECKWSEFASEVVYVMEGLLKQFGISGCDANWGSHFPLSKYFKLKSTVSGFPYEFIYNDDSTKASNIKTELKLMVDLLKGVV